MKFCIYLLLILITPGLVVAGDLPKLTTEDLNISYEVIGIINHRSGELSIDKVTLALRDKAQSMGADYVIGVRFFRDSGYLYGYGTAVKLTR